MSYLPSGGQLVKKALTGALFFIGTMGEAQSAPIVGKKSNEVALGSANLPSSSLSPIRLPLPGTAHVQGLIPDNIAKFLDDNPTPPFANKGEIGGYDLELDEKERKRIDSKSTQFTKVTDLTDSKNIKRNYTQEQLDCSKRFGLSSSECTVKGGVTELQKQCAEDLNVDPSKCNAHGVFMNRQSAVGTKLLEQIRIIESNEFLTWKDITKDMLKSVKNLDISNLSGLKNLKVSDIDGLELSTMRIYQNCPFFLTKDVFSKLQKQPSDFQLIYSHPDSYGYVQICNDFDSMIFVEFTEDYFSSGCLDDGARYIKPSRVTFPTMRDNFLSSEVDFLNTYLRADLESVEDQYSWIPCFLNPQCTKNVFSEA